MRLKTLLRQREIWAGRKDLWLISFESEETMNRIYKSVWNEQTATFVAVAENTKARGKRSSGGTSASLAVLEWVQGLRLRAVALALLSAGVLTQAAMAQVTDGWELSVDGATPFHVIPGGAFSLTSGSNIALTQTDGAVSVALSPDLNVDSLTASGPVKAASGEFTGQLTAGSATVQGNLQANTATITNQLTAGSVSAGTGTFTGMLTAPSAAIDGNLAAKSATVVGAVNSGGINTVSLTATGNTNLRAVNVNNNKISGLADAAVNASSTEAVSGKVLYGVLNSGDGIKYFHTKSTKADSVASGVDSIAIGPQATAAGEAALAAGLESEAAGKEAIALGARSGTGNTVENGIAIGSDAGTASKGSDLIAMGNGAGQRLEGKNNVAIGNQAGTAVDPLEVDDTVAIGNKAIAKATGAIALGTSADVGLLADQSVAIGQGTTIWQDASSAVALGAGSTVMSASGTALGSGARSSGGSSTAVGAGANASGSLSFAGGAGAQAHGIKSVAIGTGALSNTESGVSIGEGAGVNAGTPVIGNRFGQVAVGGEAGRGVLGGYNVALGYKSGGDITGDDTVAIGREAGSRIVGDRTVSIGYGANNLPGETGSGTPVAPPVKASNAVAVGDRSRSGATGSVAMGSMATVVDYDIGGIAIGNKALVYAGTSTRAAAGGIALGDQARVTHANSVAIGANAHSVETTGLGYGAPTGAYLASSSVSFGTTDAQRRLSNVAAGRLDTDAVNVSQLKVLHTNLESIVGGNLKWDSDGVISGPAFVIKDENGNDHTYTSIGSAFEAMRTGVAGMIGGLSAVTYSNADRTLIDLDSSTGAPVRITNLAAGVDVDDAVNKGQLDDLESTLIANRQRYVSVNSTQNPNVNNNGATGNDAIAIGAVARASGVGGTAIGLNSSAGGLQQADYTTSLGSNTEASALGATVVGSGSSAESESSMALGHEARVADTANFSTAIGYKAEVMGDGQNQTRGAIAFGERARVTQEGGIAFGRNAYDQAIDGISIGSNSSVARGATQSVALGSGSSASGSQSVALGHQAFVAGSGSLALGQGSKTRASNAVGAGSDVEADGRRSIAVGDKAKAGWIEEKTGPNGLIEYIMHGEGAMSVGAGSNAKEDGGLALGFKAISEGLDASALGTNAQALAAGSQVWGKDTRASAEKSLAMGQGAIANETAIQGMALGAGATVSAAGAVALGAGATTNAAYTSSTARYTGTVTQEAKQGVVSIGNGSEQRRITNLAGGQDLTDAVNVAQLIKLDQDLTALGTNYSGNNFSSGNSNTTIHKNLGQRLEILGGATTAGNYSGANLRTQVLNGQLQVQIAETPFFKGADMGSQKITNVAKGTTGTDAVNLSQLTDAEGGLTAKGMEFAAQSGTAVHRDLGQTLTIKGSNANLSTSTVGGNTVQVALNDDLTLTSVTTGDTEMTTAGVKVKGATGKPDVILGNTGLTIGQVNLTNAGLTAFNVVINDQGIHAGNQKITGVEKGVAATDAVNVSQLEGRDDGLTAKGMNFAGSTGTAVHRDLGETLKIVGSNSNLSTSGDGSDTLSIALNDDLDLKSVTVKGTGGAPDVVMNNLGFAIGTNIALSNAGLRAGNVMVSAADNDITGLSNRTLTGANFGKSGRAATEEQLDLVRGETQNLVDRAVKYDLNPDQSVNHGKVTMAGAESTDGGRTGGTGITNVARGDISANSTDAVNGSQIHDMGESIASGMGGGSKFENGKLVTELNVGDKTYNNVNDALGGLNTKVENVTELASAGWNIQTNGDTASNVAPKSTVQFLNGDNIEISRSGTDVTVALAQDIKVNSVVAKSVTTNEVKIVDGPTMNQQGIDMHDKTISNLADGQAPQDAVNVRQLSQATSNITNQFNHLDRRIDKVENRASAGVAAAMAMAGLPQAYVPGKSMFSVSGGVWRGESGYAMGLSTVTDSGSWVLKGNVAGSSRGDYGGSVGVGYQW